MNEELKSSPPGRKTASTLSIHVPSSSHEQWLGRKELVGPRQRPTIGTSEALVLELGWAPQGSQWTVALGPDPPQQGPAAKRHSPHAPEYGGGGRHDNGQDVDSTARRLPRCLTASSCFLTGFGEDSSLPEGLRPRRHGEEVVSFLCCLNSAIEAFIRGGGAVSRWWSPSPTTGLSPG